mmetsp:Transcript_14368/g.35843  ORF Transcript_14368/g.35843 Transcript_14368/m.35843 type:complete len:232 (+) Transcript_14368:257-952(+)
MLLDRMLEWLHISAVSAPPGDCSPPGPSSSTFIRWWCPSAGPGSDSLRRGSKRPRAADPDPDLESAPRTKTIVSEEAVVPVVVVPGASVARSERARGRTRTNAVPVLAEQRAQAEPNSGDVEPNDYNNCTNAPNTVCGAQWLLLWTTAAYAPEDPTAEEKEALRTFFAEFQDQCKDRSYAKTLERFGAPDCSSRRQIMMWLCIGQNKFRGFTVPCRYQSLLERWRHRDGYL